MGRSKGGGRRRRVGRGRRRVEGFRVRLAHLPLPFIPFANTAENHLLEDLGGVEGGGGGGKIGRSSHHSLAIPRSMYSMLMRRFLLAEFDEVDILLVMEQAGVSRERAITALTNHGGCVAHRSS